jgi:signal transduction histidine kinase
MDNAQIKNQIDARYYEYINGIILFRVRFVICAIGIPLTLIFNLIDRIAYPASGMTFLKIRCIVVVLILLFTSFTYFKRVQSNIIWLADVMGSVMIIGVGVMVFLTDGSNSRYYEGANLVLLGFSGIVNPFYIWHTIGAFLVWIGCFEFAMLANHTHFNSLNFLFANYFMISTALIVAIMVKFYKDQHYKAFVQQEQLKLNMEIMKRDKEEIEKAEKALQEQAEDLARSNKDLEQFAYIASHDLQEPLRMVASFCQKLEKRYKDQLDQDANEYIHFAVDGAKRMQLLVDALLSYAKVGKKDVEIQEVDLNKTLQTILHDLDAVIKDKNATIKVGKLPVIMANGIQMSQLFQNFLTNALKFKGERDPVVEVSARKEKDGWEFVVSDNGIGIDEKHFPKMFAIFHRLHERGNYPGTGIGLALCKKIIENFDGKVWVTSKVGEGTSFYFILNVKEAGV